MLYHEHPDVVRGRASGYPECCIRFFVMTWWRFNNFHNHRRGLHLWTLHWGDGRGYIPCPLCKFRKIDKCSTQQSSPVVTSSESGARTFSLEVISKLDSVEEPIKLSKNSRWLVVRVLPSSKE